MALPQNDCGNERSYAGKTKASSPLERETNNKKQREDVNEQSFMELTPSPEINSPTNRNNSMTDRKSPNSHSDTQNINNAVPTHIPVENPQVISQVIRAEIHEIPDPLRTVQPD